MTFEKKDSTDKKVVSEVTPDDITKAKTPESLAEATTAALDDEALGGHTTQDDAK